MQFNNKTNLKILVLFIKIFNVTLIVIFKHCFRRSKWLKGCKDNILLDKSSSRNLLCSDHFADDYFVDENGKKTIKTNAMPLPTKFTDQSMPNLDTSQQVPKEKEGSKSQFDKPQSMVLDLRIKRYPKRKLTTTFHHCRFCAFLYPKPLLMSPFKRNVTSVIKKLYPEKVYILYFWKAFKFLHACLFDYSTRRCGPLTVTICLNTFARRVLVVWRTTNKCLGKWKCQWKSCKSRENIRA